MSRSNINKVFYAKTYHPIQAGSIDGTDIAPHDNAVYRALLCSSAGLYDPFSDPKLIGDPYRTVFVGRLSHFTSEEILRKAMSKYGQVKNLRLVRDIVTGASRGYAFVEYETEREMHRAYKDAHHSYIDDSEVIVDYCRQQLMPGWIPRRLGGGLGGKKESGQLRFGGRERPFRAPLVPVPLDDLKRLGIPPPPEGKYKSRFEIPSPPRRKRVSIDRDESPDKRTSIDPEDIRHRSGSMDMEDHHEQRRSADKEERYGKRHSIEKEEQHCRLSSHRRNSVEREDWHHKRSSMYRQMDYERDSEEPRDQKHGSRSNRHKRKRSTSRDSFSYL